MNALSLHRLSRAALLAGLSPVSRVLDKLNYLVFGCYIPGGAKIGSGCQIAYGGMSVVIHGDSVIGENCLIGQGITLGAKEPYVSRDKKEAPVVGNDVYIAAGARLLGGITIGDQSVIAANAVVLSSFPANSVIAGVPAKRVKATDLGYKAIRR